MHSPLNTAKNSIVIREKVQQQQQVQQNQEFKSNNKIDEKKTNNLKKFMNKLFC